MRAKIGILASWFIVGLGVFAGIKFSPFLSLPALVAAMTTRRLARLSLPTCLGDERAGIVTVVILLCMWIDFLFHIQQWLRFVAQISFFVLLLLGVAFVLNHDIKLLIAPGQKKTA